MQLTSHHFQLEVRQAMRSRIHSRPLRTYIQLLDFDVYSVQYQCLESFIFHSIDHSSHPAGWSPRRRGVRMTGRDPVFITKKSRTVSSQDSGSGPFATFTSKRWRTKHATARSSIRARFFPAQLVGPVEKGMNVDGSSTTGSVWALAPAGYWRTEAGSQRSGQNASGKGEKYRGSRWSE
jgi:hypothetical protein